MKKTTAISTRLPAVDVEYDARGKRTTKHFEDANEAKAFYVAKEKAGKNPRVVAGTLDAPATATTKKEPPAAKVTRTEVVGRVLARHGLDAKLDNLIAEVDAEFGTANPRESIFALRNARNAIKGFLAGSKA
jgi:hypothetical protein